MHQDIFLRGYMPNLESLFPEGTSELLQTNKLVLEAIESGNPESVKNAMGIHAEEERFFFDTTH
jgi:hypothetical protein